MEHMCSSWLMDWALPFMHLPEPHLMSCPSPGVHSPPWHLFTWQRPPRDRCLTFSINIAPSSPAWSPFPRQSNHANLMAGWREVEVAPPILWCGHECLDCCTLTLFSSTYTRSVPVYSSVSVCRFARWKFPCRNCIAVHLVVLFIYSRVWTIPWFLWTINHFSLFLMLNMKGLRSSTWKKNVMLKMLSIDLMELILAGKEGESELSGQRWADVKKEYWPVRT